MSRAWEKTIPNKKGIIEQRPNFPFLVEIIRCYGYSTLPITIILLNNERQDQPLYYPEFQLSCKCE